MLKIFCDKKNCGVEIEDKGDFGTFTSIIKRINFDPKSHQQIPQLEKKEFHICEKHAKKILEFLENTEDKTKVDE